MSLSMGLYCVVTFAGVTFARVTLSPGSLSPWLVTIWSYSEGNITFYKDIFTRDLASEATQATHWKTVKVEASESDVQEIYITFDSPNFDIIITFINVNYTIRNICLFHFHFPAIPEHIP